ncbi:S-adenosyl-L-methionine-dependent methyltransferase [Aspergillus sclerotioniger CBS 115572]|uniref:S-adenosyl-L-methionine-dependent methyltransferase n=1 Tax=Aspergillus sclerotioniger CBS 115572 TaxID=1450535 RepID=A0A317VEK0_9EURO|nr:S-adenosyl-L-methionine-dependent methyltransferase [Aspergillus sclerotioniger CBS 115572]PWY71497.1 S-adenosyl-L-methionine-dependent methyltransferase [Aspergillus sclerotioniger CBS 115572]
MPRIPNRTILNAYRQGHLLPLLLQECRTLGSAKNELRWLKDRAIHKAQLNLARRAVTSKHCFQGWRSLLRSMCRARSRGLPLQYILGDQPFGDLDIRCKRGVLIPRPETETFTFHAANLILNDMINERHFPVENRATSLRILDLCTGTGCISLLLHALVAPHVQKISIIGIDISATAIDLARNNLMHNVRRGYLSDRALTDITFKQGDVLDAVGDVFGSSSHTGPPPDVIISNPPYISEESFGNGATTRSVRMFEPRIALVPSKDHHDMSELPLKGQEDIFYYHILSRSFRLKTSLVILECGDHSQGGRVAALCNDLAAEYFQVGNLRINIWPAVDKGIADHGSEEYTEPCVVIVQRYN